MENNNEKEALTTDEQIADSFEEEVFEEESTEIEAAELAEKDAEAEALKIKTEMAQGIAVKAVTTASMTVAGIWPCVQYPAELQAEVAGKLAPVLAKYNCDYPEWLKPYMQEFELGLLLSTVAFKTWRQINHFKKLEQKEEEAAKKRGAESGGESQQQAGE